MVCAVGKLKGRSLTFLGYVDPVAGPASTDDPTGRLYPFEADLTMLSGQVAASLKQHRAQVLISHGSKGEYGHPAHVLVHTAARLAVESLARESAQGEAPAFYSFAATYPEHVYPRLTNADDPAHFVVDVSPWLDEKEAAALCHQSQTALFVRRRSEAAGRQLSVREVLLTREGVHRHWPPVTGEPDDVFALFIRASGR
jgi:LmbE family N-acetylglucosaminyl deacetylase